MRWTLIPILATRLIGRTIELAGEQFKGASILPFFDRTGRIQHIVITTGDSGDFFLLSAEQTIVRLATLGTIRIPGSAKPLGKRSLRKIAQLWHYDPAWLLDDKPFRGHWARDALKNTNCVGRLRPGTIVFYQGDFSRIQWILHRGEEGGLSVARWDDSRLPAIPPALKPQAWPKTSPTWILDPIWSRAVSRGPRPI